MTAKILLGLSDRYLIVISSMFVLTFGQTIAFAQCDEPFIDTLVARVYYGSYENGYISSDIQFDSLATPRESDTTFVYYYTNTTTSGVSTGSLRQLKSGIVYVADIDDPFGPMYCWVCIPIGTTVEDGNSRLTYVTDIQSAVLGQIETVKVYRRYWINPNDTTHVVPSGIYHISSRYGIVRVLDSETLSVKYEIVAAVYDGKHYGLQVSVQHESHFGGVAGSPSECGLSLNVSQSTLEVTGRCGGRAMMKVFSLRGLSQSEDAQFIDLATLSRGPCFIRVWCTTHPTHAPSFRSYFLGLHRF